MDVHAYDRKTSGFKRWPVFQQMLTVALYTSAFQYRRHIGLQKEQQQSKQTTEKKNIKTNSKKQKKRKANNKKKIN